MLSKNQIQFIKSLSIKKFRDESGCFVAEGTKIISDLAQNIACRTLFATAQWLGANKINAAEIVEVAESEIQRISNQRTPQGAAAVFQMPAFRWDRESISSRISLALDEVQDPGNVGTIVRIADWFGIEHIFCSVGCADVFSPKVVQATMGALAKVQVHYVDLPDFLKNIEMEIFGTFLDGADIYSENLPKSGIVVLGNEGNGISPKIETLITRRLTIPPFSPAPIADSLNVSTAAAVVCSEFFRRK